MSKAITFATTGAVAGNVIANNLNSAPGRIYDSVKNGKSNFRDSMDSLKDDYYGETQGYDVAFEKRQEREEKRARREFYKDKEEIAKAQSLAGEIKYKGDINDIMDAKYDYYKAGIKDEKLINNSIKSEYKNNGALSSRAHNEYVSATSFLDKNGYTAKDISDEKNMNRIEEKVQTKLKNPEDQVRVMNTLSSILGEKDLYEQRRKNGMTRIKQEGPPPVEKEKPPRQKPPTV